MIELKELSFSYGRDTENVLKNISFRLDDGHVAAVLGKNGAGKSTLLKCVDRILRPQSGHVLVDGKDVFALSGLEMAREVAYVAQNARSSNLSVFDTVLLGRRPYIRWDVSAADREIVMGLLTRLKLEKLMLRELSQLSGGEAQKVLLARALAQEPRLLLLDEPTSNLDPRNQHEVMQLVRQIARERNICVICVLHDLNLAIRYCDRYLLLQDGEVYAAGGRECLDNKTIDTVYDMQIHTIDYMGIPVIVPFPDDPVDKKNTDRSTEES